LRSPSTSPENRLKPRLFGSQMAGASYKRYLKQPMLKRFVHILYKIR